MGSISLEETLKRLIDFNTSAAKHMSAEDARALTASFAPFGCVRIKLEPVLVQRIKNAIAACETYFLLPEEEKKAFSASVVGAAGHNAFRTEEYTGTNRKEERESFVINTVKPGLPEDTMFFCGAQPWPLRPEAFRVHLEALHRYIHALAESFMRVLAVGCGVAPDFFDGMLRNGSFGARVIRYPAGYEDRLALSLSSHRDAGLLTVLLGVTAPGLQVLDSTTGEFIAVTPPEDEAFVMAGEALAMVTAGRLPAPVHRVRAMSPSDCDRFVIANFLAGNDEARLRQMFPEADNAYLNENNAYAEMTPIEFAESRLKEWRYDPEYSSYDADMIGPDGAPRLFA